MAEGVDPRTGGKVPDDHVLNHPDCIRALSFALNTIEFHRSRKKRSLPENHGQPWSQEDDEVLLKMFKAGMSNGKIAAHFKRNINGIKGRLHRLGVLDNAPREILE